MPCRRNATKLHLRMSSSPLHGSFGLAPLNLHSTALPSSIVDTPFGSSSLPTRSKTFSRAGAPLHYCLLQLEEELFEMQGEPCYLSFSSFSSVVEQRPAKSMDESGFSSLLVGEWPCLVGSSFSMTPRRRRLDQLERTRVSGLMFDPIIYQASR